MALLSGGFGDDEIRELKLNLEEASASPDPTKLRSALATIVAQMAQGNSMSPLFPELVKICATTDLPSKKLVYLYMAGCACEQPRLALLVINCLLKDCQDANPMVRGMALRTLCSLRLPLLLEYIEPPMLAGLRDKSAYVRRIAVLGCLKAYKLNSAFITERNIVDQLCELMADRDNAVVINVLCVLHELQGGLSVSQHIAHHLLNRLSSLSEWGQIKALQFLMSYHPQTEQEIFDMLNLIDGSLRHPNSGVSLGAIHLMLHLTRSLPEVSKDVLRKLKGLLLGHLTSDQPAFVFAALSHLDWLNKQHPQSLTKYYKKFYCKYNEPTYLRCKRIDLLVQVTSESNVSEIVGELSVYCTDISPRFGRHAVQALAYVSQQHPLYLTPCMDALMGLLQLGISHVSSAVLCQMQDLLSLEGKFQDYTAQVLDLIPVCWSSTEDEDGRCAMIWLLGHHGQKLPDSPYLLESAIDNIVEETSRRVKGHLLTATAKLFFTRPAECQDSLATLLQHCVETENDVHLKENAVLYYKLLNTDVNKARKVICSSQQLRTPTTRSAPEGQPLNEGLFNSFKMLLDSGDLRESSGSRLQLPCGRATGTPSPGVPPSNPDLGTAEEGTLVDLDLDIIETRTSLTLQDSGTAPEKNSNEASILIEEALHLSSNSAAAGHNDERMDAGEDILGKSDPDVLQKKEDPFGLRSVPVETSKSHHGDALEGASGLDSDSMKDPPLGNASPGATAESDNGGSGIMSSVPAGTGEKLNPSHKEKNIAASVKAPGASLPTGEDEKVISSVALSVSSTFGKGEEEMSSEVPDEGYKDGVPGEKASMAPSGPSPIDGQHRSGEAGDVISQDDAVSSLLDPDCTLSPQDFEEKWMSWTTSETFETRTGSLGQPSSILKKLNESGLKTMATTPDAAESWRAFLYTQTKGGELFLLQVTTRQSEGTASVCIKSIGEKPAPSLQQVASLCKVALQ